MLAGQYNLELIGREWTEGRLQLYRYVGSIPTTSTMLNSYLNNKGKVVVISEMVDAYLLNSYAYYKKRLESSKTESFMSEYDIDLLDRVKSLKAEIDKRKLI